MERVINDTAYSVYVYTMHVRTPVGGKMSFMYLYQRNGECEALFAAGNVAALLLKKSNWMVAT